jgi:hypothetical protein
MPNSAWPPNFWLIILTGSAIFDIGSCIPVREAKMFDSQDRKLHFGLLIMRLGIAAVLLLHGLPKLFDGI